MNFLLEQLRALAGKVVVPRLEARLKRFEASLADARNVQREVLFAKLRRHEGTAFGKDHGFASIKTVADFRQRIPIQGYDYYWPYIERVANGELGALFPPGDRIRMFTLSSGTTATPKLIPVNDVWLKEYQRGWQLWGLRTFLDHHQLFYRKVAGIAGNWDMRRTPSGVACGMASGLSARTQSFLMRMVYCIPPAVFGIEDPDAKYYAALRVALRENAGMFATATPATAVKFAQLGDQHKEALIRDLADGTLSERFAIPAEVRQSLAPRLKKAPQRAKQLEEIVRRTGTLYPKDYWDVGMVACWLGGTVGGYAKHLGDYWGDAPRRDIGLLCSEGRFTLPLEDHTPAGVLEIASHYYEFIPVEEIDSPQPTVLEAHELAEGQDYFILLTTSSGLCRYHISDVLRCVGFRGQAPVLEFLNKGQRFSDLEGEKLSENQLVEAVHHAAGNAGLRISAFTAVPQRPAEGPPHYLLMVEAPDVPDDERGRALLRGVDEWLAAHNVMYQGKRSDRYLGPPRLMKLPGGAWPAFDLAEIKRRGVGEDHYKHPSLILDEAFPARFESRGGLALE